VAGGRHLWNGGTFAFRPEVLLEEARRHLPEVHDPLADVYAARASRSFPRALAAAYAVLPAISVDYGLMEKTSRIEVLSAPLRWDDLGTWDAVARHMAPDAAGNRVRGAATLVEAEGCVVYAGEGHVALLGVKDLIVVRTKDTVLVLRRGRGEDVRRVVARLEAEGLERLL
jgi:mannose-1-phosphate guanylyltransferase